MGLSAEFTYAHRGYYGDGKTENTYKWEDLVPVWEDPKGEGQLVGLHTPTDVSTFGTVMGHCAASHSLWIESRNWYYATVVSPDWKPHLSVLLRRVKEDKKATAAAKEAGFRDSLAYAFDGYRLHNTSWVPDFCWKYVPHVIPENAEPEPEKHSKEWYDWRSKYGLMSAQPKGFIQVVYDGVPCVVNQAYARGGTIDKKHSATRILKEWFLANVIDGAEPVGEEA